MLINRFQPALGYTNKQKQTPLKLLKFGNADEKVQFKKFHAHIYFDATTKNKAENIQKSLKKVFNLNSHLVDRPVGPHLTPMVALHFDGKHFNDIVQWLMKNRDGLKVLVHPDDNPKTDDLINHRDRPIWMGIEDGIVPIRLDFFA